MTAYGETMVPGCEQTTGRWRRASVGLALGACLYAIPARAQEAKPETFEDGIPAHVNASRPNSISLSHIRSKHGARSLRWDWQGGDTLRIDHGLGNIRRQGGYGGSYSKATFGVWLYSENVVDKALTFAFREGDETTGSFVFPLTFSGWRRAHLRYSWKPQFNGKVSPDTDNILIGAPDAGSGTVFIDLITYNGILDYRRQHVPSSETWQAPPRDPERFPLPDSISQEERRGLYLVEQRMQDAAKGQITVTEQLVADLQETVAEWYIERLPDGSTSGRPIVKEPEFYTELGLENVDGPREICRLMKQVAVAHANCEDSNLRNTLEASYLLLADHIHDQGMTAGAGFPWNWYNGRELATATFLMRDTLRRHGRLERDGDYFDSNYGFSRVFDDTTIHPNMDYFHLAVRNIIRGALMQDSEAERIRCLRAMARRLSKDILYVGRDGFRPDGSAFHHGMHYFAYANYSMNTLCYLLSHLAGTPYQVSSEALDLIKTVILNMRFTCNLTDLPLPLCGRHPHSQRLGTKKFLWLAKAIGGQAGDLDQDLARAYLRFYPDEAVDPQFEQAGLTPEPHPQGELTMPHAGLLAIRRDHWLALIKGYSRYVRFGEIYANNNRFGRYLSHGYLDILAGGSPVSRDESGCMADGWDWNRLDGTTVIVLPEDKLRAVRKGTESVPTDETFCGAVTAADGGAVFGLILHGAERHDDSFRARKSYHWLAQAGLIVCLGSAIECDDPEHPVQTTLFQKALKTPDQPTVVNGIVQEKLGGPEELDSGALNRLVDTQGTGYLVPPDQRLTVTRRQQTNRDQHDKTETSGIFACAWLDHGTQPDGGSYHYAVMPDSQPETLEKVAARMQTDQPAYRVIKRDESLHAVLYPSADGHTVSAAFFTAGSLAPGETVVPPFKVDGPCLLVATRERDALKLAVCGPDLRLDPEFRSQSAQRSIMIRGIWRLAPNRIAQKNVRITTREQVTRLDVTCRDGQSVRICLARDG